MSNAQQPNARRLGCEYEIRVRGPIGPMMLHAFPTLTAHRRGEDTVLCGSLADQAALYGVLYQIEALGLELLEVRNPEAAPSRGTNLRREPS